MQGAKLVPARRMVRVQLRGLRIKRQRGERRVQIGQSAALAVKRRLLFRRAPPRLPDFRDFGRKRRIRLGRVAAPQRFEGGSLARLRQRGDGRADVFFDAGFRLARLKGAAAGQRRFSCLLSSPAQS